MIDPAPSLPYRRMSRWTGEIYLAMGQSTARHLTARHGPGVVALLLARLCAPDWTGGGTIARPDAPVRFGSINALARSLDRPFETVRRHVHALAADGIVAIGEHGVSIAADAAAASRIVAFYVEAHDLLIRLIEELNAIGGLLPPPRRAPARPTLPAVLATALDIALLPFETWRNSLGEWRSMTIWGTIAAANVRHITIDPVLSARFDRDYVPDEDRVPASLAMVARTLSIPYATTWRHAAALEKRGLVRQVEGGWLVGEAQYRLPAIERDAGVTAAYGLRRVSELVTAGLDPARTAALYLGARPSLVAFS